MSTVFYTLALLACPVGMGLMMWFMMRGKHKDGAAAPLSPDDAAELTRLRAEADQLRESPKDRHPAPATGVR
ncbi:hypothetical protein [Cryobacterium fucosi]|uniref:DUF2933 domain-containing protein n=1 Tax=Cryobacterium fucosi TaxID=1259157 RepID=A0A4R9BFW4_9MICO|nr:hypothetical protein [Cryobacterium fucosi]TFD81590.1 hypothetical protein E3T48_03285 [Cryobacterium fucosi]